MTYNLRNKSMDKSFSILICLGNSGSSAQRYEKITRHQAQYFNLKHFGGTQHILWRRVSLVLSLISDKRILIEKKRKILQAYVAGGKRRKIRKKTYQDTTVKHFAFNNDEGKQPRSLHSYIHKPVSVFILFFIFISTTFCYIRNTFAQTQHKQHKISGRYIISYMCVDEKMRS